ncbi:hypothetical protein PCK2_000370 [Pneumocystis canis]|nr:hypothetical protein PCK2_000370 [Pneumocystis canis]
MPNSSNISEKVGIRFGSLNLAGQENMPFLNKEKPKIESNSIPKNVSITLHSSADSTLQKSKSIENSEQSELRPQPEKIYSESSNSTQQPYPSSNHISSLPSNLIRSNQPLSLHEHKHAHYESYDQNSYGNYANHQIQEQTQNFRNFAFPNECQGFYRSEDPRPHFAQGYYDHSVFPREQLSDTAIHRDISNTTNEYVQTSRFDPGVLEGSAIPSHHNVSDPVLPKHMPTDPNAILQHHSSAQSHYHQTQTYPIHPYYNPYATYYMNQGIYMEGFSTPPFRYSNLPPTPPTPLHDSSYDDLMEKLPENREREVSWMDELSPISLNALLMQKKTPYNVLEKKNKICTDERKLSFFPRKRPKEQDKPICRVFQDDNVFLYDEKNLFFSKTKDILNTAKEPIKRSNQPHDSQGFSFVFRGKKVIRPFIEGEFHDLKPKQLFKQEILSPYNENSYINFNTNEKFNENRADMTQIINIGKPREYPKSRSQNSSTNQSTQWPSQQKSAPSNNPVEYTGERLNTVSQQGNPLQPMQNFQQSPILPVYPGSSYTYPTHLPQSLQQSHHQGTPGVPGAPTQTAPASLSYSLCGRTIGYHGPYQSLLNHQDHPNANWANYPSH